MPGTEIPATADAKLNVDNKDKAIINYNSSQWDTESSQYDNQ
jgi:hypothetical protein